MAGIPLRLLICEDVEDDMLLLLRELRAGGYDVASTRVEDATAMRAALAEREWDLVVSDYAMPRFSALDALRTLRESKRDLPFIIVSGTIGEDRAVEAMLAGANDFVSKQSLKRLVPAVQRELQQAKSRAERVRAEEALRHSEARFRTLVGSMDAVIFTVDRDGRFETITGRALTRLNVQPHAWIGRVVREVLPPLVAQGHEDVFRRALFGETATLDWELEVPGAAGATRQLAMNTVVSPMREHDVVGLVGVMRDVSEEKNVQAQLLVSDRMASVGTLAAGIAHEINNPLASAVANVELALAELADLERTSTQPGAAPLPLQSIREELTDVRTATERVRQIVVDLRVFSRSAEPARGPLDVARVLESSLRMTWNEIRHRARLVKDMQPIPAVDGNESRLGQVFVNLLVNAAQSIPIGRADENTIRVATSHDKATNKVTIEIADTGAGMPPAVLARLFTPFFTTKSVGEGTGLGLSICHRIVAAHGGEIRVESKVDAGTTFRVILPASAFAAPPVDAAVAERAASATTAPTKRGRILVVDDEPLVGKAVSRALSREHDVEVLVSARAALARLQSGDNFDVILCDLMMPEMTGMELWTEVQKIGDGSIATRMIFLTGGAFTPHARSFVDGTTNLVLDKPFEPKQLRAVVSERLKKA